MDDIGNPFRYLRACADSAPEGTHEVAKEVRQVISNAMDELQRGLLLVGLKVNQCDAAHACEAAMYAYVKASNPNCPTFAVAEGFGEACEGPAGERVISQAARDRDAAAALSLAPYHDAKTCAETCGHLGAKGVHLLTCPNNNYSEHNS